MEHSKTGNRSAIAQAIKRRDDAMRDILGMGSDPAGNEVNKRQKPPPVSIWRIAGNSDCSRAGWTDAVTGRRSASGGQPMRRAPTTVSGVWLFLLSSVLRRNGLLSLHLWSRHKPPAGQR